LRARGVAPRAARRAGTAAGGGSGVESIQHFRSLATDILLGNAVKNAYDLEKEDPRVRAAYGDHLGGHIPAATSAAAFTLRPNCFSLSLTSSSSITE
jgi:hypothetical protein